MSAEEQTQRRTQIAPDLETEGIPDHEGPLENKALTGDAQEGLPPPGNQAAGQDYGITAAEQRRDERLDQRLRREQPDVERTARSPRVGRIVEPQSGVDEVDATKESVALDVDDPGGFTAEEQAMAETEL
jgi:hypothetical protein